jgi:RNA polymerase sigma-70 factor (ECF subfamily)
MTQAVPVCEHKPLLEPWVIEEARTGDRGAFNRIVLAYRKRVLCTVARLIGRPDDVEDVVQEVFVRLYLSLGRLRSPQAFEAWLNRIVANTSCDYLRRRKRVHEVNLSDLGEGQAQAAIHAAASQCTAEDRHQARLRDRVDFILASIPAKDRVLLALKEIDGMSLKDLEEVYGVESGVLRRRLFRARQRTLKAMQSNV